MCQAIALALCLPVGEVFRKAGLMPAESADDEDAVELAMCYAALPAADRLRLLMVARALYRSTESRSASPVDAGLVLLPARPGR